MRRVVMARGASDQIGGKKELDTGRSSGGPGIMATVMSSVASAGRGAKEALSHLDKTVIASGRVALPPDRLAAPRASPSKVVAAEAPGPALHDTSNFPEPPPSRSKAARTRAAPVELDSFAAADGPAAAFSSPSARGPSDKHTSTAVGHTGHAGGGSGTFFFDISDSGEDDLDPSATAGSGSEGDGRGLLDSRPDVASSEDVSDDESTETRSESEVEAPEVAAVEADHHAAEAQQQGTEATRSSSESVEARSESKDEALLVAAAEEDDHAATEAQQQGGGASRSSAESDESKEKTPLEAVLTIHPVAHPAAPAPAEQTQPLSEAVHVHAEAPLAAPSSCLPVRRFGNGSSRPAPRATNTRPRNSGGRDGGGGGGAASSTPESGHLRRGLDDGRPETESEKAGESKADADVGAAADKHDGEGDQNDTGGEGGDDHEVGGDATQFYPSWGSKHDMRDVVWKLLSLLVVCAATAGLVMNLLSAANSDDDVGSDVQAHAATMASVTSGLLAASWMLLICTAHVLSRSTDSSPPAALSLIAWVPAEGVGRHQRRATDPRAAYAVRIGFALSVMNTIMHVGVTSVCQLPYFWWSTRTDVIVAQVAKLFQQAVQVALLVPLMRGTYIHFPWQDSKKPMSHPPRSQYEAPLLSLLLAAGIANVFNIFDEILPGTLQGNVDHLCLENTLPSSMQVFVVAGRLGSFVVYAESAYYIRLFYLSINLEPQLQRGQVEGSTEQTVLLSKYKAAGQRMAMPLLQQEDGEFKADDMTETMRLRLPRPPIWDTVTRYAALFAVTVVAVVSGMAAVLDGPGCDPVDSRATKPAMLMLPLIVVCALAVVGAAPLVLPESLRHNTCSWMLVLEGSHGVRSGNDVMFTSLLVVAVLSSVVLFSMASSAIDMVPQVAECTDPAVVRTWYCAAECAFAAGAIAVYRLTALVPLNYGLSSSEKTPAKLHSITMQLSADMWRCNGIVGVAAGLLVATTCNSFIDAYYPDQLSGNAYTVRAMRYFFTPVRFTFCVATVGAALSLRHRVRRYARSWNLA